MSTGCRYQMTRHVVTLIAVVHLMSPASAQTPLAQRRARPRPPSSQVVVARDFSGSPIKGVRGSISGPQTDQAATGAKGIAGTALPDGSYRLRFEHQQVITLGDAA